MIEKRTERIQKVIARSGLASRRKAEKLILSGRVCVNGEVVRVLGTQVSDHDVVAVDGRRLPGLERLVLALNKPRGYVCSRETVGKFPSYLELLPQRYAHLHHVGRLDVASEGLLFVSSIGDFTQLITHPSFQVPKYYLVTVRGAVSAGLVEGCLRGRIVDGEQLRFEALSIVGERGGESTFRVTLLGGKNREIRRLFGSFGLEVSQLQRVGIGEVRLEGMALGDFRILTESEVESFSCYQRVS